MGWPDRSEGSLFLSTTVESVFRGTDDEKHQHLSHRYFGKMGAAGACHDALAIDHPTTNTVHAFVRLHFRSLFTTTIATRYHCHRHRHPHPRPSSDLMIMLSWFDVVSIAFFVISTLWVAHRVDDDVKAFDVLETTINGAFIGIHSHFYLKL